MSKQKKVLFDDVEKEEEDGELHINHSYANRYKEWRLSEELQKYKDRYGDEEDLSSESSSDEDFAEADNPEFDREFLRTMGALYKKADPKLKDAKFFTGDYSKKKDLQKEEKAMTVKDYERLIITEHGGDLEEEEGQRSVKGTNMLINDKEKYSFDDDLSSDEDAGDGLLTSGLFKVKKCAKPKEEKEENQEDPLAFIRGDCSSLRNEEDRGLLEGLKKAWSDPKKSKDEKWLIDYFVNERYNEEEDATKLRPYNSVVIDEESISDDEKTLEAMETFETKYRFRFEEPDEEFIKKYPRIISDSMRGKDERRRLKRTELKDRKQKEKEVKRQEIERLKALKYKEIEAKIEKIKEASGNQDIDLGDKLFEDDFDEAHHEEVMSRVFGEEYYGCDDGNDEKPVFDDDDIDVIRDYDHWMEQQGASTVDGEDAGNWEEEEPRSYSMDNDYNERGGTKKVLQQEMIQASSKRSRKKSKFANAIKKKKPVFDPMEKTFESYFEEYYQLDFEDLIGDTPCRFKYRKVEPNSYGLSTEEILSAQDKELNKWASLKKMLQYQRDDMAEQRDFNMYQHRSSLPHVKQKILPSLFVEDPVEHHISEEEKKRLKNQKKKLRKQQKLMASMEENPESRSIMTPDSTSKNAMKRKNGNQYPMQDNENSNDCRASTEDTEQPKKKKKKHNRNVNYDEKLGVEINQVYNETKIVEEQLPSKNTTVNKWNVKEVESLDNSKGFSKVVKKKKKKKEKEQSIIVKTETPDIFQGISDSRLTAYGANPKKIRNKVKYQKKDL